MSLDMYQEQVMDHYRSPRNRGTIEHADITFHDYNPLCGDEVVLTVKVNDSRIADIKFSGQGCAISQAATSMLTEEVTGKTFKEVLGMQNKEVLGLLGIPISPARLKCALLGFKALEKGIVAYESQRENGISH